MARRTNFSRSSSRPRRPVEWFRGDTQVTVISGVAAGVGAAAFNISAGFPSFLDLTSPTIVRIRGMLFVSAVLSTGAVCPWAAGFLQMSTKAFGVGITAIPIPISDDADWQWFMGGAVGDGTSTTAQPQEDVHNIMVDTKAMRCYEQDDQALVFVLANRSGIAATDIVMHLSFSVLVKE